MKAKNVLFGVAGYPPAFWKAGYKDRLLGPKWLNQIDIDLLEVQMTYGPRMKEDNAKILRDNSEIYDIKLSIHASYFIVLTSDNPDTISRSYETLEKTCRLAEIMHVNRIILHPGTARNDRFKALDNFIRNMRHFEKNYLPDNIYIYPETAGKINQLGNYDEIINMCNNLKCNIPCIDYGHLHARLKKDGEKYDTVASIQNNVKTTIDSLRENLRNQLHFHITPMEYGDGGEIRHRAYGESVNFAEKDDLFNNSVPYYPKPEHLSEALASLDISAWVVSECHDTQELGAIAMKRRFQQVKGTSCT